MTESFKYLVHYIGIELCQENSAKVESIVGLLLQQGNTMCDFSSIDLWGYCLLYRLDCVDKFAEKMLCFYDAEKQYRLKLIPHFVEYLEAQLSGEYREFIFSKLLLISEIDEKIVLIRAVEYKKDLCDSTKKKTEKSIR